MANPRKFSEKIAMHTQKQAEGTAAFEAILREVSATTRGTNVPQQQQQQQQQSSQTVHQLTQPPVNVYRGRSLPNVNQMVSHNSIDLQSALSSLEDMKHQAMGRMVANTGKCTTNEKLHRTQAERSGSQPRKHFALARHRDCSPYGSLYLSPPPDANWRRASSDSALHSSVIAAPGQTLSGSGLVLNNEHVYSSDNITVCFSGLSHQGEGSQTWDDKDMAGRPRSCDVPGINIYPSPEPSSSSTVQVPVANNTGSLPNLTNMNLQSTLDRDGASTGHTQPVACFGGQVNATVQILPQHRGVMPSRIQRQMVPAPLVLHNSNYIFMENSGSDGDAMVISAHPNSSPISPAAHRSPVFSTQSAGLVHDVGQTQFSTDSFYLQTYNSDTFPQNFQSTNNSSPRQQINQAAMSSPCQLTPTVAHHINQTVISPNQLTPNSISPRHNNSPQQQQQQQQQQQLNQTILSQQPGLAQAAMLNHDCNSSFHFLTHSNATPGILAQVTASTQFFTSANFAASQSLAQSNTTPMLLTSSVLAEAAAQQKAAVEASISNQGLLEGVNRPAGLLTMASLPPTQLILKQEPGTQANNSQQLTYAGMDQSVAIQQQRQANVLQQKFQQFTVGQKKVNDLSEIQLDEAALQSLSPGMTNFVLMSTDPNCPSTLVRNLYSNNCQMMPYSQQQGQSSTPQSADQQPSVGLQFLLTQSAADNSIPDIVLTAEDLAMYASQVMAEDEKNSAFLNRFENGFQTWLQNDGFMDQQSDDSKDPLNALTYLGDSFDGEIFTTEDALRLALDPLELEELQMLADSSILTDPATEDSFRLDRP